MSNEIGALFHMKPYPIRGGIVGDEHGLSFEGVWRFKTVSELRLALDDNSVKKTKSWLRAHCAFLGLPYHKSLNIPDLTLSLVNALESSSIEFLPDLTELEQHAKQQFRAARHQVESMMASLPAFSPPQSYLPPITALSPISDLPPPTVDQNEMPPLASPLAVHSSPTPTVGISHARSPSSEIPQVARPIKKVRLLVKESAPVVLEDVNVGLSQDQAHLEYNRMSPLVPGRIELQGAANSRRGCSAGSCKTEKLCKKSPFPTAEACVRQLTGATAEHIANQVTGIMRQLARTEAPVTAPGTSATLLASIPILDDSPSHPTTVQPALDEQGIKYAMECLAADRSAGFANFDRFRMMIQLCIWFCRDCQVRGRGHGIAAAYRRLFPDENVAPLSNRQFERYITDGYTLLMLIYASSIYILPVLAVSSMNSAINHLTCTDREPVEQLLRDPDHKNPMPTIDAAFTARIFADNPALICRFLRVIRADIGALRAIPAPAPALRSGFLREFIPAECGFFRCGILARHPYVVPIFKPDLTESTAPGNFAMLPRHSIWLTPPPPAAAPTPPTSVRQIRTAYNWALERNRKMPQSLLDDPVAWTQEQREWVSRGVRLDTMKEFEQQLQLLHERGFKTKNKYLWFPAKLAEEDTIIMGVSGTEDNVICVRLSNNTITNREELLLQTKDFTQLGDQKVSSAEQDPKARYKSWYIGIWNRRVWNGANHKDGQHVRLRVAYVTQAQIHLDHAALDLAGDRQEKYLYDAPLERFHAMVQKALRPVIQKLRQYIPELMGKHQQVYDSLGPVWNLGSGPFCMTVLNLQLSTKGHRDTSDMVNSICLVLALGDFSGGQLCLFEPGLVLDLLHGTCAAIRSKRDTHFNLDFQGQRYSFVFTSDQVLRRWDKWRNHWEELRPEAPYIPDDILDQLQNAEQPEETEFYDDSQDLESEDEQ
ncbi:DEAD-box ATP-dependent RNA helicase 42 [Ceratobasidium sp. AG-Ba]|nr:DEAD-box ATP-dependent RNA helicase 42 [Ceratobasidium sp. AG-Ba]